MTGVSDSFSGLDFEAVDWGGLTHAYGSAQDVPARIKALVAPDADVRSAALGELFSSICHQGTVCTASAPAIPFLARALVCAPGERALIGLLMALMARQYGEDWSDPSTRSGAVRAQVASVLEELVPLLADPDPDVRRATLRLVAVCPADLVRALCDLREFDDGDGRVRADALMALARVEHDWPGLRRRLEDGLLDGSPAVRQAASLILLSLDGLPFPQDTAAVLADSLSAVGDLWAEPRDESWDRLPGTSLPDPHVEGAPAGLEALGVLTTLSLDRDGALEAATSPTPLPGSPMTAPRTESLMPTTPCGTGPAPCSASRSHEGADATGESDAGYQFGGGIGEDEMGLSIPSARKGGKSRG